MPTTDVVVVGGGIAGLYAAWLCASKGAQVVVLERTARLGGRIFTVRRGRSRYEAGAARIGTHHTRAMGLMRRFHIPMAPYPVHEQYREAQAPPVRPPPHAATLAQVAAFAHGMPPSRLCQMTFTQLCEQALGADACRLAKASFGYDAEFDHMNAASALASFQDDGVSTGDPASYYACPNGLESLVRALVEDAQAKGVRIFTNTAVRSVRSVWSGQSERGARMTVTAMDKRGKPWRYTARACICAIPRGDALQLRGLTRPQKDLLDSVDPVSLHKVFGKFPNPPPTGPWFAHVPHTTTDAPLQRFVPAHVDTGIALLSYTDGARANMWKALADRGDRELRRELRKQLHVVFPEVPAIPKSHWIATHYWPNGMHVWKPGVDTARTQASVTHLMGEGAPFWLVGEAYSQLQGWIEGALATVDAILPEVEAHLQATGGAGGAGGASGASGAGGASRITRKQLHDMRRADPSLAWILLRDPRDGVLKAVNVTAWMFEHPGGVSPIATRLFKDATADFRAVPGHGDTLAMWTLIDQKKMVMGAVV